MIAGSYPGAERQNVLVTGETGAGIFSRNREGQRSPSQLMVKPFSELLATFGVGYDAASSVDGGVNRFDLGKGEPEENEDDTRSSVRKATRRIPQRPDDEEPSVSALSMAAAERESARAAAAVFGANKGIGGQQTATGAMSSAAVSSLTGDPRYGGSEKFAKKPDELRNQDELEGDRLDVQQSGVGLSNPKDKAEAVASEDTDGVDDTQLFQGITFNGSENDSSPSSDDGGDGGSHGSAPGVSQEGALNPSDGVTMQKQALFAPCLGSGGVGQIMGGDGTGSESSPSHEGTGATSSIGGPAAQRGPGESLRLVPSPAAEALVLGVAQQGEVGKGGGNASLHGGEGASAPHSPEPLERSRVLRAMERIEKSLKGLVEAKESKSISLRLDPPSLGAITVEVSFRDGELQARLAPELPQVAAALRERSHELQAALRKMGLSVDNVRVSIEGGGRGFDQGADAGGSSSFRDAWHHNSRGHGGLRDMESGGIEGSAAEFSHRPGVWDGESGWIA